MSNNRSPYDILFQWLFSKDLNYNVPNEIIESKISAKYILLNFMNIPKLCLFFDKYFNTYDIYQIKDEDIFKELKILCNKYNVNKKDILYIPFKKLEKNKIVDNLRSRIPYLKKIELEYLYDKLSDDEDFLKFLETYDILSTERKGKKRKSKKSKKNIIGSKTEKSVNINNEDNLVNNIVNTDLNSKNEPETSLKQNIKILNQNSINVSEKVIDDISKLKLDSYLLNDYYLIDIHNKNNKALYILKHKQNNKKLFYLYNDDKDFFFFINNNKNIYNNLNDKTNRLINLNYNDYVNKKYNDLNNLDTEITYESDVLLEDKHTALYLRNLNKIDDIYNLKLNIMFFDIEVDTGEYRGFPDPMKGEFPINSISYSLPNGNIKNIFVTKDTNLSEEEIISNMFNKNNFIQKETIIDLITKYENKIEFKKCKNEKELLLEFLKDLRFYEYDIITAWNISFDIVYIINRMKKLRIDTRLLSPITKDNSVNISYGDYYLNNYNAIIDGLIVIDMLHLYKQFTFGSKESYSLSFIAKEELKDDKIKFEDENLSQLYSNNFYDFLWYNIKDVDIIIKLNEKLKHIELLNIFRILSKCSWYSCKSTNGIVDNLLVNTLLSKNVIVRNYVKKYIKDDKIPGAYVMTPKGGIYNFVIDLDFASLYPNIIRTFNIGHDSLVGNVTNDDIVFYYIFDRSKLSDDIKIKIEINLFNGGNKYLEFNLNDFDDFMKDKILTITGTIYYKHSVKKSLLFDIMTNLLDSRKVYKNKMLEAIQNKDEFMRSTYNNIQLSFKTLANSIYGILLFSGSRWFNQHMGKSITQTGSLTSRFSAIFCDKKINNTINNIYDFSEKDKDQCIEKFKKEFFEKDIDTKYVIYMDTDSLYVNVNDIVKNEENEKKKIDKVLNEIGPNISHFLNNDIIKNYYLNTFFKIEDNFNTFLSLKQEVIARTAYFKHNIKKKYAMLIINKEGKELIEQDVKGLEIKRSDFPNLTKIKLTTLLDYILEERININKINNFIKETEIEMLEKIKEGDIVIAKPVSFSKKFENYKVIPQHIKGMLFWNELEYNFFLPGTKGYLFYLKGINLNIAPKDIIDKYNILNQNKKYKHLNNLDVIVIPNNLKKLPDYYIIDKIRSIDFVWTERYNQLIGEMLKINETKKQQRSIPTF